MEQEEAVMFRVGEVWRTGWEKFKQNAGVLVGAFLLMIAIQMVVGTVFSMGLPSTATEIDSIAMPLLLGLLSFTLNVSLSTFLMLGFVSICLKVLGDQPVGIGDLFGQVDKLMQGLIASSLIGVGIMFGMVLLIVPGIVFGMLTGLSTWYLVDQDMSAISAIKASVEATKGALGSILVFGLVVLVLWVPVMVLSLGLGMFVFVPVVNLAWGAVYVSLSKASAFAPPV